jgi:hypothetical protein
MRHHRLVPIVAVLAVAVAIPATAQDASQDGRATSLAVTAGMSRASDATHLALGGDALFELTAHFALQGAGRWMDRGSHPDAYAAELCALVGFAGTRDTRVPYVTAGVGFQRRTFNVADASVPAFYRRRLGIGDGRLGTRQTLTDPTVVIGTGIDFALSRTLTVRPDVRAVFAVNDGRHETVMLATVSLGYRFEHKPVTPSRR